MSEMLGNQYFMARNYSAAKNELERCYINNPANKPVKKKLIVCYLQTNEFSKALEFFLFFLKNDIKFIIDTDPEKDDCPCPEIVQEIILSGLLETDPNTAKLKLAVIYLFIDVNKSFRLFDELKNDSVQLPIIEDALYYIRNYLNEHPTVV